MPSGHPDFTFSVVGEEFGLLACLAIMGLFLFIIVRALRTSGHVVGFIGTFGPWHGAEVLAEAFGRLIAKRPDYRATVRLGADGPSLDALRRLPVDTLVLPSHGKPFRGLHTRIDHVIDYATPLGAPGFYFMDSPGNDLEGIAGQVGAGCNLFLFVTGNGSITNFPFVPTIKVVTTKPGLVPGQFFQKAMMDDARAADVAGGVEQMRIGCEG